MGLYRVQNNTNLSMKGTNTVANATTLLAEAVYYIDATDASASSQTVTNLGTAGSLLPTTVGSSTAADSNDPKFLDHTGTNYVYLPGVAGNNMTIPDSAALDITGDIDLRFYGAPDAWTASGFDQALISKSGTGNSRSYWMWLPSSGSANTLKPVFEWTTDGIYANRLSAVSTANIPFTAGQPGWIRVTLDVDNGAGGKDVKFFTSTDGTTWTQLGSTVTTAGTTSIFAGTDQVEIGSRASTATLYVGKVFRAQVFNGIDGTKVLDVDTSVITAGSATSFTAVTGQTVTINRSTSGRKTVAVTQPTWLFGTDDYMEVNNRYMSSGTYLYLPGVAGNYASAPDSAAVSITGDIDLRCKVALDDWTPSAETTLIAKRVISGNQMSYALVINTTGTIGLFQSVNGSSITTLAVSTVATGVADGATKWVRATLDVDNGAGGRGIQFFLSDDGTSWTQLGTTVTAAGTTSIFDSTAPLEIGSIANGASNVARGKFFRAQVLNGIDGTVAFDANFETSITSLLQTTFTESSANAATVTINRSGSTYRSAGITAAGYLYPGATNTFAASATDFLNFGASQSFTLLGVLRYWNTMAGGARPVIGKLSSANGNGYSLEFVSGSFFGRIGINDGTNSQTRTTPTAITAGGLTSLLGQVDRNSNTMIAYNNLAGSATASSSAVGAPNSSFFNLRIGGFSDTTSFNFDGEVYAIAVWRRRLLAPEIAALNTYFAARD